MWSSRAIVSIAPIPPDCLKKLEHIKPRVASIHGEHILGEELYEVHSTMGWQLLVHSEAEASWVRGSTWVEGGKRISLTGEKRKRQSVVGKRIQLEECKAGG